MVEETVEEMARTKGRIVPGAATYKTYFNSEWTSKWPFITVESTSSYHWCSISAAKRNPVPIKVCGM